MSEAIHASQKWVEGKISKNLDGKVDKAASLKKLDEKYTLKQVKAKVDEIVAILKGEA